MKQLLTTMEESLLEGIEEGIFPGGLSSVKIADEQVVTAAMGSIGNDECSEKAAVSTVYDLASLTKVIVTLPAVLLSIQKGKMQLFDEVQKHLPEFCKGKDSEQKKEITVFHLLTHLSGLPGWRPFFITCKGRGNYIRAISEEPLIGKPGCQVVYSDLGFMLLGFILERIWNMNLQEIADLLIFQPFEMNHTAFNPLESVVTDRIAPTELGNAFEKNMAMEYLQQQKQNSIDRYSFQENELLAVPWRKSTIIGTVHDCNAYYGLNGVSGHAGLFSTISDLQRYMRIWSDPKCGFIDPELLSISTQCQTGFLAPMRGLGWELSPTGGSREQKMASCSGGDTLSAHAFGHTGFTGTSIWHDQNRQATLLVLTNRVHEKVNPHIVSWRKIHHHLLFSNI